MGAVDSARKIGVYSKSVKGNLLVFIKIILDSVFALFKQGYTFINMFQRVINFIY